jgi:hypothetical protein
MKLLPLVSSCPLRRGIPNKHYVLILARTFSLSNQSMQYMLLSEGPLDLEETNLIGLLPKAFVSNGSFFKATK